MFELFQLFMQKPLEAVVAALCICVLAIQLGLLKVQEAQAVTESNQKTNEKVHEQVTNMNDSLIRIDENVKIMKKQIVPASPNKEITL